MDFMIDYLPVAFPYTLFDDDSRILAALPSRRGFLIAAGGLILVTATSCAGGDGTTTGNVPIPSTATRRVRSGEGMIEIRPNANRIVTTVHGWDAAVTLGQQDRVVGVTEWDVFLDYVEYLDETRTKKMTPLGSLEGSASIEQIAALKPDLIVVPYWNSKDLVSRDELKRIAPFAEMVVPDYPRPYNTWKGSLRAYAEIYGVSEQAEAYISEQEAAAEELRQDIATSPVAGETVHLAYYIGADRGWRVDQRSNTASLVLEDLELPRPKQPKLQDGGVELSMELTSQLDAGHLWVYLAEPGMQQELQNNPLWQQLRAVRNGTARIVPSYWNSGYSLAIPRIIADIRRYMLGEQR